MRTVRLVAVGRRVKSPEPVIAKVKPRRRHEQIRVLPRTLKRSAGEGKNSKRTKGAGRKYAPG